MSFTACSQNSAPSPQAVRCHSTAKVADACRGSSKCPCCRCGKFSFCKTKYIQPERPKSFKPERTYMRPETTMAGDTVYKMSYPGLASAARPSPIIPRTNLVTSGGDVSDHTVYKMSYPGWSGVLKQEPILPQQRRLLGDGPMQDETTQRHDYQPQPPSRPEPIRPAHQLVASDKPLDDLTTMIASYLPPDPHHVLRPRSFAPQRRYAKPSVPIDAKTVQKMSYGLWQMVGRPDMPWAKKAVYQPPCQPMDINTVYNMSYAGSKGEVGRRQPIKHPGAGDPLSDSRQFYDSTVYRYSYLPIPDGHKHRPSPIKARSQLHTSQARMDPNTTHQMSYPGWSGVPRQEPILPQQRRLLGDGPMQDETTQRHDYQPQPPSRPEPVLPTHHLVASDKPLDGLTTMLASYQPPGDGQTARPRSFAPQRVYQPSCTPMDDKTIHKMSFLPQQVPRKEDLPWARRGVYQPPCQPMDTNTIYKASYEPPGGVIKVCEPSTCSPCDCCQCPHIPPRSTPAQTCFC